MIWLAAISKAAPALFDELESLREEVERLRTIHAEYGDRHARIGMDLERAAIVAWLRAHGPALLPDHGPRAAALLTAAADAIKHCDHHESAGK